MPKLKKTFLTLSSLPLLILLASALALVAGEARGATYYVNASGGDDSRTTAQAASSETPWLTLNGAEAKASAGDTVRVAAGTYLEDHATLHCWNTVKGITWIADGSVLVRRKSGSYVQVMGAGAGASFTGFTLDGQTSATYGVYETSTAITGKSYTNCTISSCTTNAVKVDGKNYSFTNCTLSASNPIAGKISTSTLTRCTIAGTQSLFTAVSGGGGGMIFTSCTLSCAAANSFYNILYLRASGDYSFIGNTITFTGTPRTLLTLDNISGNLTVSGNTVSGTKTSLSAVVITTGTMASTISGNTIALTASDSTQNVLYFVDQASPVTVSANTIASSQTLGGSMIRFESTGRTCIAPVIVNNTLRSRSTNQYDICVGSDTPNAGDGKLNGATITGNRVWSAGSGRHNIFVGMNANATIARNYVNGGGYGVIVKAEATTVTYASGGIFSNMLVNCVGDSSIHIKGRIANVRVHNNTIANIPPVAASHEPIFLVVNGAGNAPSGVELKNNLLLTNGVAFVRAESAACFGEINYNLYYANGDISTFGLTATNFAQWQALGYDANGVNADPTLDSSYSPLVGSPAIDAGVDVGLTADFIGTTVPQGAAPDIGAYEYVAPATTSGKRMPAVLIGAGVL